MAREKNASEENNAFEAAYRDEMINNLIAGSACASARRRPILACFLT